MKRRKLPEWAESWVEMIQETEEESYRPAPWCGAFLDALKECGIVSHAARAAGVDRSHVYRYAKAHCWFTEALADAREIGLDALELEARRRAVEGVDEPVFYQGIECGAKRRYSDTLLIFLLKAGRPEKYRERVTLSAETFERITEQMGLEVVKVVKDPEVLEAISNAWGAIHVE